MPAHYDPFISALMIGFQRNHDYANKLVADLADEQMIHQPAANTNHPAWVLRHLHAYREVIIALLAGDNPDDPKDHRFGMLSKPEADAGLYGSKAEILADFNAAGAGVLEELQARGLEAMTAPMPIQRWTEPFPRIGDAMGYVMLCHEGVHLGQLSAWRRVQGLPSV